MTIGPRIRALLRDATDVRLLQWQPSTLLVMMLTFYHLSASVDLGASSLLLRVPLAIASMLPALLTIRIAHSIAARRKRLHTPLVLASYAVGGALRGWLLGFLLELTGILPQGAGSYRLLAGAVYVTVTAVLITVSWSKLEDSRVSVAQLQQEAASLERSVVQLQNASRAQDAERIIAMGRSISEQLAEILNFRSDAQRERLRSLVDDVIRPLSRRLAPDTNVAVSHEVASSPVQWRPVFIALDPVKHLWKPAALVAIVLLAAMSSFATFHDLRTVAALSVVVGVTLFISMYVTAGLAPRLMCRIPIAWRAPALAVCFTVMAVPPSFATRVVLANTAEPMAYVIPGLLVIPVLTWVLVIARASADYFQRTSAELARVHEQLRWSIARLNLVSWHRQGIISRLLHGPVQNNIQVAIMRLQSADDDEHLTILTEVIARIEDSVRAAVDTDASPARDLAALRASVGNWSSVAAIELKTPKECATVLMEDPAACAIFVDVAMEACSNAIRHGGATRLELASECTPRGLLMHVVDNGTANVRTGGGLGTEMMAACSIAFSVERTDATNTLSLELPTAPLLTHRAR